MKRKLAFFVCAMLACDAYALESQPPQSAQRWRDERCCGPVSLYVLAKLADQPLDLEEIIRIARPSDKGRTKSLRTVGAFLAAFVYILCKMVRRGVRKALLKSFATDGTRATGLFRGWRLPLSLTRSSFFKLAILYCGFAFANEHARGEHVLPRSVKTALEQNSSLFSKASITGQKSRKIISSIEDVKSLFGTLESRDEFEKTLGFELKFNGPFFRESVVHPRGPTMRVNS
ncbi:hypothetical protein [Crateriforma conspicua]|uniref:Peptidase C39 domain-containing protein n=1 Tax=Crateriforma conspicua TaxID=2527996 RepID=A0A5C6FRI9_9PLAN|nr:hypothetical protein [Crateriforma conspicua]TWU63178.1 hypothetical protein V7x_49180 [Crateriforma conspicua]